MSGAIDAVDGVEVLPRCCGCVRDAFAGSVLGFSLQTLNEVLGGPCAPRDADPLAVNDADDATIIG